MVLLLDCCNVRVVCTARQPQVVALDHHLSCAILGAGDSVSGALVLRGWSSVERLVGVPVDASAGGLCCARLLGA